jgi:hypothetical protein
MEHWYQNPHMSLFEIQQSNSIQDFSKNILGTLFLLFKKGRSTKNLLRDSV